MNAKLIDADNAFGLKLLGVIARGERDKNLCLSPVSAALALQMAYNGSGGKTRQAMSETLSLSGMDLKQLDADNATLLADLNRGGGSTLRIANSFWCGKRSVLPPNPGYVQQMRQSYGAEVNDLDGAPASVNAWVQKATGGKIDTIVSKADLNNVVAILVNAVYFKGAWTDKFDPQLTADAVFHAPDGPHSVKMMHRKGRIDYLRSGDFQAVRLPYGDGSTQACLILPDPGVKISDFIARLTPENWQFWQTKFRHGEGTLGLPRFRMEGEVDLKQPLIELGMGIAFQEIKADFSGIAGSPGEVWIGKARQKTFIEVNEEGTEASAATGLVMRTRSVMVLTQFDLTLDRPFLYAIVDQKTGALLFVGAVMNPAA